MDLNLDNYSLSELMTILQISKNEINVKEISQLKGLIPYNIFQNHLKT